MKQCPQKEKEWRKRPPPRGGKGPPNITFFQGVGSERILFPTPLWVLMSKCDYKTHNICRNYSSHNDMKIPSTLHPVELFIKKFSRKSLSLNPLAIKLNIVIRTAWSTTQAGCITMSPCYLKIYNPMVEHGFLPLINGHSFRHLRPLPDKVCGHNAMLAFPQEKISHYTTVLV